MRLPLMLLALCFLLPAEEAKPKPLPREEFTLADGRKFVGTYNEDAESLILDGGKMSLKIAPEQIVARKAKPAEAVVAEPAKVDAKTMTPEEKEAAMAGFRAGQAAAAKAKLLALADQEEREAESYDQKAKSRRDQAARDAEKFQIRCKQEGSNPGIGAILAGPVATKKTNATNGAILGIIDTAKMLEQKAKESRAAAIRLRAEAAAPWRGAIRRCAAGSSTPASVPRIRRSAPPSMHSSPPAAPSPRPRDGARSRRSATRGRAASPWSGQVRGRCSPALRTAPSPA